MEYIYYNTTESNSHPHHSNPGRDKAPVFGLVVDHPAGTKVPATHSPKISPIWATLNGGYTPCGWGVLRRRVVGFFHWIGFPQHPSLQGFWFIFSGWVAPHISMCVGTANCHHPPRTIIQKNWGGV